MVHVPFTIRREPLTVSLVDNLDASVNQICPTCGYMYFVRTTTAYSWPWGCNIHRLVFIQLVGQVNIICLARGSFWNLMFWFCRVPQENNTRMSRNLPFTGESKVSFCILDLNVMRFSHDSLVGIRIFYLAMKVVTLTSCRPVKLLPIVLQPILKRNIYRVKE
jgi:hypothetical protein